MKGNKSSVFDVLKVFMDEIFRQVTAGFFLTGRLRGRKISAGRSLTRSFCRDLVSKKQADRTLLFVIGMKDFEEQKEKGKLEIWKKLPDDGLQAIIKNPKTDHKIVHLSDLPRSFH